MTHRLFWISLSIACFITPGVSQSKTPDRTRLEQTIQQFYDSIGRGDPLLRIPLLDDDVILMPNGWTMIRGKEAAAGAFTADTATRIFRLKERTIADMAIGDGIAYTVNTYFYTFHRKGEDPQWHKTKNVHIWRKDQRGNWKLRVDIWNSDTRIDIRP